MHYTWLIPLLPAGGAAVNGLAGIGWFSRRTSGLVACAAIGAAFVLALAASWQLLGLPAGARSHDVVMATWIPGLPLQMHDGRYAPFQVDWGIHLDALAAVMALAITGIGTVIHVHSAVHMAREPRARVARFFCASNLLCAFMLVLVLGSSFLTMFAGWEGVGLCSYLLFGGWHDNRSSAGAGRIVTGRVSDGAFLIGILMVASAFGTLDIRAVQASAPLAAGYFGVLPMICLLLFVGAVGRTAQTSLRVRRPDAMDGPPAVSGRVHAATVVIAGVYVVGRSAVVFSQASLVAVAATLAGVLILSGVFVLPHLYRMAR